jgi:hypothetical protein
MILPAPSPATRSPQISIIPGLAPSPQLGVEHGSAATISGDAFEQRKKQRPSPKPKLYSVLGLRSIMLTVKRFKSQANINSQSTRPWDKRQKMMSKIASDDGKLKDNGGCLDRN